MTTAQQIPTSAERREITRNEIRKAIANLKPQLVGVGDLATMRLTAPQIAAAKGIGRKRAMEIIESLGG